MYPFCSKTYSIYRTAEFSYVIKYVYLCAAFTEHYPIRHFAGCLSFFVHQVLAYPHNSLGPGKRLAMGWSVRVRTPAWSTVFLGVSISFQTNPGVPAVSSTLGTMVLSRGVKRLKRVFDHTSSCRREVAMRSAVPSVPLLTCCRMLWGDLTFTFR